MTDMSVIRARSTSRHLGREHMSGVTMAISLLLIAGLPMAFWMAMLELVNHIWSIGLSNTVRWIVAGTLAGLLTLIWAIMMTSVRSDQIRERDARR